MSVGVAEALGVDGGVVLGVVAGVEGDGDGDGDGGRGIAVCVDAVPKSAEGSGHPAAPSGYRTMRPSAPSKAVASIVGAGPSKVNVPPVISVDPARRNANACAPIEVSVEGNVSVSIEVLQKACAPMDVTPLGNVTADTCVIPNTDAATAVIALGMVTEPVTPEP